MSRAPCVWPDWITGLRADGSPYRPSGRWGAYVSRIGDYMTRAIIETPWGSLRLHHIRRPDRGRHHHDHPFDFVSVLLTGGYVEERNPWDVVRAARLPGSVAFRRAEDLHTISAVLPGTWTFVVAGPRRREWGFATPRRWIGWRDYREEA